MYRKLLAVLLVLVFLLPVSCSQAAAKPDNLPAAGQAEKTIAIIDIEQETNVFSPIKTTLDDFKARDLNYGDDLITQSLKERDQVAGFLAAVKEYGGGKVAVVPILQAKAASGGPIERAVYERFKKEAMDGLHGIKKLDGVYLSLHGSMGVDGLWDPEGDLLQAIRDEYGAALPIATSYDLHANMTEKKAKLATIIVGFKTNPHRDFYAAGYSCGRMLVKTVLGQIHPTMTVDKLKLLRGGGQNIDFLPPMDTVFNRMKDMEKMPGVLSVSNFMVHIWLDEPNMGWGTVAITDNDKALADRLADEIAERDWAVRDVPISQTLYSPSEAVKAARAAWLERLTGTTMFCDISDTVGTGSPGENTWILKALNEEGPDLVSYVPVRDSQVVQDLWDQALNKTVTVTVGGKIEKIYNQPYTFTGQIIFKGDCVDGPRASGRAVVLKNQGVHLIVCDFAPVTYFPGFFFSLGLDLWKADIVVAKNLFPFRFRFLEYNRKTFNVVSKGTTNIDVFQLKYNNMSRPIYPLDKVDSWQWYKW